MARSDKCLIWQAVPFIIVSGCIIAMISFGPRSSLGLFLNPMTEFRGWSVGTFSFALALQNLMWGAGQPFAGAFADKYGTARVLAFGAVLYAIGLLIMAQAEAAFWLHISAGVLIGLGMSAASFSIVLSAFGRAVSPSQRSIAFGVGTAAGSLGQFVFAIGGGALIASQGWQSTLYIFAALTLLIIPLSFVLKTRKGADETSTQDTQPEPTLREALKLAAKHPSYLLLIAGFFVCGFHVSFITVHLPPFLKDLGFDVQLAGIAIAFIGGFNIIGSLASGYIGSYDMVWYLGIGLSVFAGLVHWPIKEEPVVDRRLRLS